MVPALDHSGVRVCIVTRFGTFRNSIARTFHCMHQGVMDDLGIPFVVWDKQKIAIVHVNR
jgi:hypothetical protein